MDGEIPALPAKRKLDDAELAEADDVSPSDSGKEKPAKKQKKKESGKEKKPRKSNKKPNQRRNIKRIGNDTELGQTTRLAQQLEAQRLERIQNRPKMIQQTLPNNIASYQKEKSVVVIDSDDSDDDCTPIPGRTVVNVNPEPGEKPVYVADELEGVLKPHQIEGVRFMWDNTVENMQSVKAGREGFGCILAHYMGLGKSLQVVTFIQVFLGQKVGTNVLLLAPVNTMQNWVHELDKWLRPEHKPNVYVLEDAPKTNDGRAQYLKEWGLRGGVMLVGFEMYRNLCQGGRVKDPELKQLLLHTLTDTPDLIVVDEGHRIKNDKTNLSKILKSLRSKRRIVMTGSPLQNNLMEYYYMVDFVRENYLGTPAEFRNRFETPINNGLCADSTDSDVKRMRERVFILQDKLKGFVQRKDYGCLTTTSMPDKHEYVVFIRLSHLQRELYGRFIRNAIHTGVGSLFKAYHALLKVWNHPEGMLEKAEDIDVALTEGGLRQTTLTTKGALKAAGGDDELGEEDDDMELTLGTAAATSTAKPDSIDLTEGDYKWWADLLDESKGYVKGCLEYSGKMMITMSIIDKTIKRGEKILIFSQSLFLLTFMEQTLSRMRGFVKNKDYFRLDGSTSAHTRQENVDKFNKPNSAATVFLISTKAGCLGINLVGANRVIVFDTSWNPVHDLQAIFRSYRFGQRRAVYIYRLVAEGTMEKKIYERQMIKHGMSLRVVDEQQVDRVFSKRDLESLFEWNGGEGINVGDGEPPVMPEDTVMRDVLAEYYADFSTLRMKRSSRRGDAPPTIADNPMPPSPDSLATDEEDNGQQPMDTSSTAPKVDEGLPAYTNQPWISSFITSDSLLQDNEEQLTEEEKQQARTNFDMAVKSEQARYNPQLEHNGRYYTQEHLEMMKRMQMQKASPSVTPRTPVNLFPTYPSTGFTPVLPPTLPAQAIDVDAIPSPTFPNIRVNASVASSNPKPPVALQIPTPTITVEDVLKATGWPAQFPVHVSVSSPATSYLSGGTPGPTPNSFIPSSSVTFPLPKLSGDPSLTPEMLESHRAQRQRTMDMARKLAQQQQASQQSSSGLHQPTRSPSTRPPLPFPVQVSVAQASPSARELAQQQASRQQALTEQLDDDNAWSSTANPATPLTTVSNTTVFPFGLPPE